MGIYDRDYMKEEGSVRRRRPVPRRTSAAPEASPRQVAIATGQMLLVFAGVFVCLRFPFPGFVKFILAAVVLWFGARWIIRKYRKA